MFKRFVAYVKNLVMPKGTVKVNEKRFSSLSVMEKEANKFLRQGYSFHMNTDPRNREYKSYVVYRLVSKNVHDKLEIVPDDTHIFTYGFMSKAPEPEKSLEAVLKYPPYTFFTDVHKFSIVIRSCNGKEFLVRLSDLANAAESEILFIKVPGLRSYVATEMQKSKSMYSLINDGPDKIFTA